MSIFTHITVGTNDLEKARTFYDAVLGAVGCKRLGDIPERGSKWGAEHAEFIVLKPIDGKPATFANGGTISFRAKNRAQVAAFHKAALQHGGKEEFPVGPRPFAPTAFGAYVRDPDGNKLAVYTMSAD